MGNKLDPEDVYYKSSLDGIIQVSGRKEAEKEMPSLKGRLKVLDGMCYDANAECVVIAIQAFCLPILLYRSSGSVANFVFFVADVRW